MYDQLERSYSVNKEIRIKTPMLIADLCHLGDAYIFVKGVIAVTDPDGAKRNKSVPFKNNAPFINYISKINNVLIDNAEDLGVVMSMYNLLEYSKNYRKTTVSLWNYYRDEPSNPLFSNYESFKYNTIIAGNAYDLGPDDNDYDANKVGNDFKHFGVKVGKHFLNDFLRSLEMPLIDCEIELILTWSKNWVLVDMTLRDAGNNNNPPTIAAHTGLEF